MQVASQYQTHHSDQCEKEIRQKRSIDPDKALSVDSFRHFEQNINSKLEEISFYKDRMNLRSISNSILMNIDNIDFAAKNCNISNGCVINQKQTNDRIEISNKTPALRKKVDSFIYEKATSLPYADFSNILEYVENLPDCNDYEFFDANKFVDMMKKARSCINSASGIHTYGEKNFSEMSILDYKNLTLLYKKKLDKCIERLNSNLLNKLELVNSPNISEDDLKKSSDILKKFTNDLCVVREGCKFDFERDRAKNR